MKITRNKIGGNVLYDIVENNRELGGGWEELPLEEVIKLLTQMDYKEIQSDLDYSPQTFMAGLAKLLGIK